VKELRPYFGTDTALYLNPPNVVDSDLSAFGRHVENQYRLPEVRTLTPS
jgi:hypothetical protein